MFLYVLLWELWKKHIFCNISTNLFIYLVRDYYYFHPPIIHDATFPILFRRINVILLQWFYADLSLCNGSLLRGGTAGGNRNESGGMEYLWCCKLPLSVLKSVSSDFSEKNPSTLRVKVKYISSNEPAAKIVGSKKYIRHWNSGTNSNEIFSSPHKSNPIKCIAPFRFLHYKHLFTKVPRVVSPQIWSTFPCIWSVVFAPRLLNGNLLTC